MPIGPMGQRPKAAGNVYLSGPLLPFHAPAGDAGVRMPRSLTPTRPPSAEALAKAQNKAPRPKKMPIAARPIPTPCVNTSAGSSSGPPQMPPQTPQISVQPIITAALKLANEAIQAALKADG